MARYLQKSNTLILLNFFHEGGTNSRGLLLQKGIFPKIECWQLVSDAPKRRSGQALTRIKFKHTSMFVVNRREV